MRLARTIIACGCAALLLTTTTALAQQTAPRQNRAAKKSGKASQNDAMTTDGIVRSSKVIGMTVENADGKQLGSIEDVVVDLRSGKIRYAALGFGGFVGFGEKLFAIPWQALNVKAKRGGGRSHVVLYNVTEKDLEKAPGFPSDNWPDFADAKFTAGIDRYYRRGKKPGSAKKGNESATNAKRGSESSGRHAVMRASRVEGMAVYNREGKQLGTISELVFDLNRGTVRYAALSYGGFLGLGDKLFAVPMSKMSVKQENGQNRLVMNVDIETLKNAEGFDQNNWPDTAAPRWSSQIDKHYGVKKKANKSDKSKAQKK